MNNQVWQLSAYLLCMISIKCIAGLDNGLALTPPMGWLTWERFRCNTDCKTFPDTCISENLIMQMADRMAEDGWLKVGYQYIAIDDCWLAKKRSSSGELMPDPDRFPHGIKYLSDYVHSKGLKFGIYEDWGTKTCAGYPGSQYHLEQDANTFASWGVDYVKLDGCNSDPKLQVEGTLLFSQYLNKTGRPILLSCEWPLYLKNEATLDNKTLVKSCNMWRVYHDVQDSWNSVLGIINYYQKNPFDLRSWAGPGHWNDPDMLTLGNFGLSHEQERAQIGMWAMFAAPLIMSTDLRTISNSSKQLLQNPRIIALNQDPKGEQAYFLNNYGYVQVWKRYLANSTRIAVAFLNVSNQGSPTRIQFLVKSIAKTTDDLLYGQKSVSYRVLDVFTGNVVGKVNSDATLPVDINPTGIQVYIFEQIN